MRPALLLCLTACGPNDSGLQGDSGRTLPVSSPSTTTPVTSTGPAVLSGACLLSEQSTVAACTFTLDRVAPLIVEWTAPHLARPRVSERDPEQVHRFDVPLLTSQTAWTWTARSEASPGLVLSGQVVTGAVVPPPFTVQVEGVPVVEQVALATRCGASAHLAVIDSTTRRLALSVPLGEVQPESLRMTEDGHLLVLAGNTLWRVDAAGRVLARIGLGGLSPHHDAAPWGDGYAVLVEEEVTLSEYEERTDDGFVVLDAAGDERGRVWLTDVLPAPAGARDDWTHANAIGPSADAGDLLLSLRSQSAVLQVSGDPDSADFGAIRWWLAGWSEEPGLVRPSDFAVVDLLGNSADFKRQHDPSFLADGRLSVFDNRTSTDDSRVVELRLEPEAGRAVVERVWQLDRHCDFKGGARVTPEGGRLATCAPRRQVIGFAADTPEAHTWAMSVECEGDAGYLTGAWPAPW